MATLLVVGPPAAARIADCDSHRTHREGADGREKQGHAGNDDEAAPTDSRRGPLHQQAGDEPGGHARNERHERAADHGRQPGISDLRYVQP